MNSIEKIREILRERIVQKSLLNEHLIAVYLFGSLIKGKEKKKSDIDLAFVFDDTFYKTDPFTALQEADILAVEMGKEIQRVVDVVVLNGASLSFAYHTLKEGKCIYEGNTSDRILYEVALDNKYHDFMPFIKELREAKRRALIGRD
ncbi:MAG TPA: nucleotidyltransferase domain-containing protein [Nitrospirae bacterium]|nr:nucleotidyltransferase domain-containing protein [Nitrospirota bacterium]